MIGFGLSTINCVGGPQNSALSFGGDTKAPRPPAGTGGSDGVGGSGSGGDVAFGSGGAPAGGTGGSPEDAAMDRGVAAMDSPVEHVAGDLALPRDGGGCQVNVVVTTKTRPDGDFSPNNVGAIWIADAQDKFIKSLNVWAAGERSRLQRWNTVTNAAGSKANRVDAVTSASKGSDGTRSAEWNCTDFNHAPSPDGNYTVCFELNDSNGASVYQCVPFVKGPDGQEVRPPDTANFLKRIIDFSP